MLRAVTYKPFWLPVMGSNHHSRIQSAVSYH